MSAIYRYGECFFRDPPLPPPGAPPNVNSKYMVVTLAPKPSAVIGRAGGGVLVSPSQAALGSFQPGLNAFGGRSAKSEAARRISEKHVGMKIRPTGAYGSYRRSQTKWKYEANMRLRKKGEKVNGGRAMSLRAMRSEETASREIAARKLETRRPSQ
jgi:hypothetical protein